MSSTVSVWIEFILRWFHFMAGMMWIGHLYYFNYTQGVFLNSTEVDNSAKIALRTKLLPTALWYFRWGALWTFVTGLLYLGSHAHSLGGWKAMSTSSYGTLILVGALFGTTMLMNVWHVIWPKQRIVIENANRLAKGESALPAAADAGARANVASRTNTLLSIPMLFFMGGASHLPLPLTDNSNLMAFWIVVLLVWAVVEANAIKGKVYNVINTVRQVTVSGFVLTGVLVGALYLFL